MVTWGHPSIIFGFYEKRHHDIETIYKGIAFHARLHSKALLVSWLYNSGMPRHPRHHSSTGSQTLFHPLTEPSLPASPSHTANHPPILAASPSYPSRKPTSSVGVYRVSSNTNCQHTSERHIYLFPHRNTLPSGAPAVQFSDRNAVIKNRPEKKPRSSSPSSPSSSKF